MKAAFALVVLAIYILAAGLYAKAVDAWEGIESRSATRSGVVSWYGETYRGRPMANGQRYNPDALTCASVEYPLGTVLMVTYLKRSVTVTVTDRGPAQHLNRLLDLSAAAFASLAEPRIGLLRVTVTVKGRV